MPVRESLPRSARVLIGALMSAGLFRRSPRRAGRRSAGAVVSHKVQRLARCAESARHARPRAASHLNHVREGEALTSMVLCSPPDPQVLCVACRSSRRKAGDKVVVAGTYIPRGPDHVHLDPCLRHLPGESSD